jgi:hypothetical protein
VFTDLHGQPLHPEYLYYALKKLIKQADLPPIRLHDCGTPQPASHGKPART